MRSDVATPVREAIASGNRPGRLWFYTNYDCNLTCTHCLAESSPGSSRRRLTPARVLRLAHQAQDLGFTGLGVTGGEPFVLPYLPDLLKEMGEVLPTVVITNGTLFDSRRLHRVKELAGRDVAIRISLDGPEAETNDEIRGSGSFSLVCEAVPKLIDAGVRVGIATTVDPERTDPDRQARLRALVRSWGISDGDHLIRPIYARGRALDRGMGERLDHRVQPGELTVTVDGAFWSRFGPTLHDGRPDTDLLLTRTIEPLEVPAAAWLRVAAPVV